MTAGRVDYAVFLRESGQIVSKGYYAHGDEGAGFQMAAIEALWSPEGHGVVLGEADPALHYVVTLRDEPILVPRPEMRIDVDRTGVQAGGTDFAVLTGLPDPCEITVDPDAADAEATVYQVAGGGFEFAAEHAGTYAVEIDRFPFLPLRIEFTAS